MTELCRTARAIDLEPHTAAQTATANRHARTSAGRIALTLTAREGASPVRFGLCRRRYANPSRRDELPLRVYSVEKLAAKLRPRPGFLTVPSDRKSTRLNSSH